MFRTLAPADPPLPALCGPAFWWTFEVPLESRNSWGWGHTALQNVDRVCRVTEMLA